MISMLKRLHIKRINRKANSILMLETIRKSNMHPTLKNSVI